MSDEETATSTATQIEKVSVKPALFWKADPKIWFLQLEAQFALANRTVASTKFHHIVSAVDSETLSQVADISNARPTSNKYSTIKERLIAIFSYSKEQRLRRLLLEISLGEKKVNNYSARCIASVWFQSNGKRSKNVVDASSP